MKRLSALETEEILSMPVDEYVQVSISKYEQAKELIGNIYQAVSDLRIWVQENYSFYDNEIIEVCNLNDIFVYDTDEDTLNTLLNGGILEEINPTEIEKQLGTYQDDYESGVLDDDYENDYEEEF